MIELVYDMASDWLPSDQLFIIIYGLSCIMYGTYW